MTENLLEKMTNQEILVDSQIFEEIHEVKAENEKLVVSLNQSYKTAEEIRICLEKITDKSIDDSVIISQPFYTDFGKHIIFGKNVFLNQNITFVDLGGITIEDNVLIGPMTRLITVNHLIDPNKRRGVEVAPIIISKNAWLGANVTVLPGVMVGENSIVAADSTVTKDVPDNVIVAGTPARMIRDI